MDAKRRQGRVRGLLEGFRGVEPLKRLFWSELGYDRRNDHLSMRGWPEGASGALAEEPEILASGAGDGFEVIHCRLADTLLVGSERLVISRLLSEGHDRALFVFSDRDRERWHFVNARYSAGEDRRRVFRRITIGPEEEHRTASERIAMLDLEAIAANARKDPEDLSTLDIQSRHDEAFNVEPVTNEFFREYARVFGRVEALIEGIQDPERGRLFTQRLFNRLMFLAFIQKKGWLRFGESRDYLNALWRDYRNDEHSENFYRDRLKLLFFTGLNTPNEVDVRGINQGGYTRDLIGDVPYLNGGLFEREPDGTDDEDAAVSVPDEAVALILSDLFGRFNFTVTESTPLDMEVAVDPEMLGKVFEELVTDRNDKGAYYTPKSVVSFMCKEVLKGHLGGHEALIDEHDISNVNLQEARNLLGKLAEIKVVDPACGSGAYLLGMVQELHVLNGLLDTRAQGTPRADYDRKLEIIQNNVYGVDRDDFATNIARLRLWLSLVVDYDGDDPQPLPNLDFKIEAGDSLTAPDPSGAMQMDLSRGSSIQDLFALKTSYLKADGEEKKRLRRQIEQIKQEISAWIHPDGDVEGFDWQVEFAEVFAEGGFDAVIANPPYGLSVGDNVRDLYFDRRADGPQSKDSYGIFMARALQLLRSGGQFSFIVSDTWRTIKSHKPLRKRLLEQTTVAHVLDLPQWIFGATVNTCILTLAKGKPPEGHNLVAGDLRSIRQGDWGTLEKNLTTVAGHIVDMQTTTYAHYAYSQDLIATHQGLTFFIGSPHLYELMSDERFERLGDVATIRTGLQTGDNEYYLRKRNKARGGYQILDEDKLLTEQDIASLTDEERRDGVDPAKYGGRCFVPYDKGGESDTEGGWLPNYNVPTQYFIDWSRTTVQRLRKATIADYKRRKGLDNKVKPRDETTRAAVISWTLAICKERG